MHFVACIKQVPDTTDVKINPETNTLMREGVDSIVNPFDMYAIEEALRLEPPVLVLSRLVPETFEYKGNAFKKGQLIMLSIAGANRDPKVTQSPEAFNIHREAFEHVSFAHGIHLCLGMPLARLEAEAALNQLLDRFPDLTLPEQDLEWSDSPFFRGLEQLTVRTAVR